MNHVEYIESWVDALGLNHDSISKLEHFDDRRFKFSLYLLNQDGAAIKIRKGAIKELYIEDNVMDWFHHGYLLMLNPDDVMERSQSVYMSDNVESSPTDITPYHFRGDARDMLLLTFEPHVEPGEVNETVFQQLSNMVYTMKFLFTVYATEDVVEQPGRKHKMQKMYFHDYRYQLLREKNLYYSTAKNLGPIGTSSSLTTPVTHRTNTGRSKPTGEIIQDILKTALVQPAVDGMFSYHWDYGGTDMFYTSPASYKAIDDLNYVLNRHVSSDKYQNQPCLFRLQRYTERWELLPIEEYFKRTKSEYGDTTGPGAYQSEFFLLSNDSEPPYDMFGKQDVPPRRKTFGTRIQTPMNNYHFPDLSVIDDFVFSEINGSDCQELLNSVITHRYSEADKTFGVDLTEHNIKNIHDMFQSNLVSHMFGFDKKFTNNSAGAGAGYSSWLPDSSREKNYNFRVNASWSPDATKSLSVGRNKLLLSAFLMGNTIQFDVRGETSRRAGVWVAVDRDTHYVDNEYDKKVLGQYFVTRVTHRITSTGEYVNNIMGVKPYFTGGPDRYTMNTTDLFAKDTNETPI